ncbi:2Fe-2S iron-sulfur cluster-binding protein [Treponema sp. HNW]|uniref:(2Fe-2S)-binding protein n=1 Tax=Treponema sp. HNW TaxID=3116654 RepID=UPI003D0AA81D
MLIRLNINHNPLNAECRAEEPLSAVLRRAGFFSVKCGCGKGLCGACTVFIQGRSVPSCLIPVSAVRDAEIITLEYFMQTEDYLDIELAFRSTGIELCGFCNAGRIFAAHEIIESGSRTEAFVIMERLRTFSCSCTEDEPLADAIMLASEIRRKRLGSIKYGR